MKLSILLFCLMQLFMCEDIYGQNNTGQEKFLLLPLVGYSDEQGLGVGANAAWLNILGSTWEAQSSIFASALYQQTFISGDITNRHFYDNFFLQGGGYFNHSGRSLFYGIENNSSLNNVTQFSAIDGYYYARAGVRVYDEIIIGGGYAHRSTGIDRGADPSLLQFQDVYSTYPRLSGTTTTSTHFFAQYDTRTPTLAPEDGNFVYTSFEQAQPRSGEDLAQQRFYLVAENYFPISEKELILVSRGVYNHEWGEDVPFFLQSRIGGFNSLRGFRSNRFVDAASTLLQFEPRFTFWEVNSPILQRLELSTGFELGRVFNYEGLPPLDSYHTDWDIGLTGLLEGGVPVRLDYAFSPESSLIYLHLFYPF